MHRWIRNGVVLLALAGLGLVGMLRARRLRSLPDPGLTRRTLVHQGRERSYLIPPPERIPASVRSLVLSLHGGGGSAEKMARAEGGTLEAQAREHGALLVWPNGYQGHWNDGRSKDSFRAHRPTFQENVDDVGFLTDLARELCQQFQIPADQIFVAGISNGGRMTLRLIRERPQFFRAASVISIAERPEILEGHSPPQDGISIAFFLGTKDPLAPYHGGPSKIFGKQLGVAASGPDTARFYAQSIGAEETETLWMPDADPEDGTRTRVHRYFGTRNREIRLFEIQGGGHVWPGGPGHYPAALLGSPVKDFHASIETIEFFLEQGMDSGHSALPAAKER